jgi:hypothetical protein
VPRELERGLDLDDDRQHHRPPARAVVDDLPERFVQVLLEELDLRHVVREQVAEDAVRLLTQLLEERFRLLAEAAGDELRRLANRIWPYSATAPARRRTRAGSAPDRPGLELVFVASPLSVR